MTFYLDGKKVSQTTFFANASAATDVWVENCPGLSVLPDLPAATNVRVWNCPNIKSAA